MAECEVLGADVVAEGVEAIFQEAQHSIAKHKKCTESLCELYSRSDPEDFADAFFGCLTCIVPVFKREPAVERIIEFAVQFATSNTKIDAADLEALVNRVCLRLLDLGATKDKAVRFRVTQIVGRIMSSMPEDAEVSEELFVAIEETMMQRCHDKVPIVRAWALRALFRLQDPYTRTDTITGELIRAMSEDTSKEVRMAAITTIAPSKHAIQAVLERTRDCCDEVRLHALSKLITKVDMKWLSISQRTEVLSSSLSDRQPEVRAKGAELLDNWLRKQKGVIELLQGLDVASYEGAAVRALRALLDESEGRAAVAAAARSWADLSAEALLCLRVYVEWLHERLHERAAADGAEADDLEAMLPELPVYCEALAKAASAYESASGKPNSFPLVQLLRLCARLDMANEYGRVQLEATLCGLLRDVRTCEELLPHLVDALRVACCAEAERFQRLTLELISEVEDPLELGDEVDSPEEAERRLNLEQFCLQTQGELGELHTQVRQRVEEEDFEAAAALKKQAKELQSRLAEAEASLRQGPSEAETAERPMRSLRLAALLLASPNVTLRSHEKEALPAKCLPLLQSARPELRALALKCLGLHCLYAAEQAASFWPLFVKALQHDQPIVQRAALRSCTDMLLTHAPSTLLTPRAEDETNPPPRASTPLAPEEDATAAAVLELLMPLLKLPDCSLRASAALAACKLLHTGRLVSTRLMSRLLLLYFLPTDDTEVPTVDAAAAAAIDDKDEAESQPRQFLSVFFAAAPPADVIRALVPALRAVHAAADGSPDSAVHVDALAGLTLSLIPQPEQDVAKDGANGGGEGSGVDSGLLCVEAGVALCCEALAETKAAAAAAIAKLFRTLPLPRGAHQTRLRVLQALLEQLQPKVSDKVAHRQLTRFQERVGEALAPEAAVDKEGGGDSAAAGPKTGDVSNEDIELQARETLDGYSSLREPAGADEQAAPSEAEVMPPPARASTPPKQKRRLAKSKATPGHIARLSDENAAHNIVG